MSIKMKELPSSERPYEKLEMYGAETLSNAELLAIIIKTGTKEKTQGLCLLSCINRFRRTKNKLYSTKDILYR